jgi:heme exporter protein C
MGKRNCILNYCLIALGFVLMMAALYLVFMYVPTDKHTGIVQRIFYFHVPLAWVSFMAFAIVFVCSICYLRKRTVKWDALANAAAEIGVIFTTLVLVTGPLWAKPTWGIWWTWDARLTTTLILWLVYIAYMLVRKYATTREQGARFAAVVGIVGFVDVPIIFLAVNLWRTQHPTTIVFEGGLTPPMVLTLLVCIVAFTVLSIVMIMQSYFLKIAEVEIDSLTAPGQAD